MDERKRSSKKQEELVAKEVEGRLTPASGALWGSKGDVKSDLFLFECKTTSHDFYTLSFTTWDKIYKEALKERLRIPVMQIDLNSGKDRLAVMRSEDIPITCFLGLPTLENDTTTTRISGPCSLTLRDKGCRKTYSLTAFPWSYFLDVVAPALQADLTQD